MTVRTASADTAAYDAARQFIHVSDTIRVMQSVGREVPWSMMNDAIDCRYRLDRALGKTMRSWTDAEWDVLVLLRLSDARSKRQAREQAPSTGWRWAA